MNLEVSRNTHTLNARRGKSSWELWLLDVHIGERLLQLRCKKVSFTSKVRREDNPHSLKEIKAVYVHPEHLQYDLEKPPNMSF